MYTMSFGWVIAIGVIMFIVVIIGGSNNAKKRKEKQDEYIKALEDNGCVWSNKTNIENGIIAIDKQNSKIIYIDDKSSSTIIKKEFPFKDIISCELIEDGKTIYSKSTARTLGGAAVGGGLLGGVGAVVGGLSGGSKEKKKIESINIKISLRDIDSPSFKFCFFEYKGTRIFIDESIKSAEEWKDRISAIIDMNNQAGA